MASEELRDTCIAEMKSHGNVATDLCAILRNQEKVTRTAKERDSTIGRKMIIARKDTLTIAIIVKIYVRRFRQSYEQFRRELNNSYTDGDKEYLSLWLRLIAGQSILSL